MLKKKYRLTSSKDFQTVYNNGKKLRGDYGMLITLQTKDPNSPPKIGFVVGKKIGNAVIRHRQVRWLRNISWKLIKEDEDRIKGMNFSYIAFKKCEDFKKLEKEFTQQVENAVRRNLK